MGAPLSAMGRSVPSRATRTVWFASPTTTPSRRTRATGLTAGFRVSSLTMLKTSSRGRPLASSAFQPGELLGDLVEDRDATRLVGCDHGVADAAQRHRQALPLGGELIRGALALGCGRAQLFGAAPEQRDQEDDQGEREETRARRPGIESVPFPLHPQVAEGEGDEHRRDEHAAKQVAARIVAPQNGRRTSIAVNQHEPQAEREECHDRRPRDAGHWRLVERADVRR